MMLADLVDFLDDSSDFEFRYKGSKVEYLNEAGAISDCSRFYLAGHEFGPSVLIHVELYRGDSFESAWEAWIDSCPTIPAEDLIEAYSPGRDKGSFLDEAIAAFRSESDAPRGHWTDEDWTTIKANAKAALDKVGQDAHDETCDYPELVEGYEWQSNCTGTGIVDVGHYANMWEVDLTEIEIVRLPKAETR